MVNIWDIVRKRAKSSVIAIPGKSQIERMGIRPDKRKAQNSTKTMEKFDEFQVILLPDPLCSPEISFSDFSSFRWRKDVMQAQ
jgi:hypothetical protein